MNMPVPSAAFLPECGPLWRHAGIARALGSPFVAAVLEAGERQLDRAPKTAKLIRQWTRDPSHDAVAMRFNAALHALARQGKLARLSALYAYRHADFDGAIGEALEAQDDYIAASLGHTPQTNEIGRSAAITAALMVARTTFGLPFELLELGASCGLNLNLGHYAFQLGTARVGSLTSPITIAPRWIGATPEAAPIEIVGARGVDLNPLDASDAATQEHLLSFIWADQPQRARRLQQAIALAQVHQTHVDRGDATSWLADQLKVPQADGVCRVVYHSMFLQYLTVAARDAIAGAIDRAGALATATRPLVRIAFERTQTDYEVRLHLTSWPGGGTKLLATCHAYGDWIEWRA